MINSDIWKKKAIAFVTRSHRHLWGKNNEEPLAFLFLNGLENQFTKDLLIGWNKFGQERLKEKWGMKERLTPDELPSNESKFLLPSGIVIPYIINKELISIFIISLSAGQTDKVILVPGSQSSTMILSESYKDQFHPIVMVSSILDGLYLYQEVRKKACVIICPNIDDKTDTEKSVDMRTGKPAIELISKSKNIPYFYYKKNKPTNDKKRLEPFSNITYYSYQSKEALVDQFKKLPDK